jgi:hypothetical protein
LKRPSNPIFSTKLGLLGVLAAATLSGSPAHADGPSQTLNRALIKSIDKVGIPSGIFATWDRWIVETQTGAAMNLFSRAFGETDALPRPGQRCNVRYHMGQEDEGIGAGLKTDAPWPMVENFTCASGPDQPAPPNR